MGGRWGEEQGFEKALTKWLPSSNVSVITYKHVD